MPIFSSGPQIRPAPQPTPPHPTAGPPLSLPTAPPPHPPAVQRSVRLEQPRQRAQPRLHGCCPGTRSHSSPPAPASDARDGSLMGRWRRAAAAAVGAADTPPPPPSVAPAAVTKGRATGRACAGGWFVMHINLLDHFWPSSATPGPSANHPCQGQHNFDESTPYEYEYTGVATVTGTGTPISVDTRQRRTPVEKSVRMEEATVASAARRRNVKRRAKRKQKLARLSRAEAAP